MGRLTLNVLLSFAQYEREITGERIRDKIAASRKKGMWMGGNIPTGYDLEDRKLIVNGEEAKTVRYIFECYLECRNVRILLARLNKEGIEKKKWVTQGGKVRGGGPFTKGALYHLLQNRTYLGEAVHKDDSYPGEHEALIAQDLWDRVQLILDTNRQTRSEALATPVKKHAGRPFVR